MDSSLDVYVYFWSTELMMVIYDPDRYGGVYKI